MNKKIFIVYFFYYSDGALTDMRAFVDRKDAEEYALKVAGEKVNKNFETLTELELWYNDFTDGMEKPGLIFIEPVELVDK